MLKDLIISTHCPPRRARPAAPQAGVDPAPSCLDPARCVDLAHCRLTVVAKNYWVAYSEQKKLVEFRSGNQTVALTEGMLLLFSMNASERRRGNTDLVSAEVLTVLRLPCAQAYARFPAEAHACKLQQLCANWHCGTVNCIVFKKNSLHRTKMLVNLAQGNLGILRQFMDTTGFPRFCHIDDLGRSFTVRNNTGKTVTSTFHASWPTASNTRRARPALAGEDDGGQATRQGTKRALDSTQEFAGDDAVRRLKSSKSGHYSAAAPSVVASDMKRLSRQTTSLVHASPESRIELGMYIAVDEQSVRRAVTLTRRMTSLPNEHPVDVNTVAAFKELAQKIPCFARVAEKAVPMSERLAINHEINAMVELNVGCSLSSNSISRFRLESLGPSGAACIKSAGNRSAAFVSRVITYVANLVAVSIMLDGAPRTCCDSYTLWKDSLLSWVMKTFRQECKRLLSPQLYERSLWIKGDNPLEEVIASFCLEPDGQPTKGNFKRCDKCLCEIGDGVDHGVSDLVCCECGKARCMQCFGVMAPIRLARRADNRMYWCEWCLEKHKCDCLDDCQTSNCLTSQASKCDARRLRKSVKKPCLTLLQPDLSVKLCTSCGIDLTDSKFPARCWHCRRTLCESCVATCSGDLEVKSSVSFIGYRATDGNLAGPGKPLESERTVALIACLFCVGRTSFLAGRLLAFKKLVRAQFPSIRDPLQMQDSDTIQRSDIRMTTRGLAAITDFVYALHYAGYREVSSQCLTFTLKLVSAQVLPVREFDRLQSSVSPFNMLHFMGHHPLANHKMLENVCLSAASWSKKTGAELLLGIGNDLEPLQPFQDGIARFRVGFYGENMFKMGPLLDLAGQAIVTLSKAKAFSEKFQVFLFGVGSDDDVSISSYPPLRELWDNFAPEFRICMDAKASAEDKLKQFRAAKLDVFISLPGWTGSEDLGPILHCRAAPVQLNWFEFASVMYAPGLVDFTILGQAVGNEQRHCQTRERLAEIVSPGTCQPVQSFALLDAVRSRPFKKDRAYWGLPVDKFILFVAGTPNRLDFSTYAVHPYWDMALQIPDGIFLFLDAAGWRSYILARLAEYNDSQANTNKVDPSRLHFLHRMHDKGDYWELLEAVGHEGARGTTVCSFGPVSFDTDVGDAFMMCVPHHTSKYPTGTMQQRVASEIVTAVGLESQCVGATTAETVKKVVSYAHDRDLQDRMIGHMKQGREDRVGFWDVMRGARFLAYAVVHAYGQVKSACGDRNKLADFKIPFEARTMEALDPDAQQADMSRYKLLTDAGMPVELLKVTANMLEAMEMQGGTLLKLEGTGAFTVAILAKFQSRPAASAVIKISKKGVFPAQVHNSPLFREAKCLGEWHRDMRHHQFVGLIPKPFDVLEDRVFFGHSCPNEDGHVVPFLICEHIPCSFSDMAERHRNNWQENGLLEDSFRVEVVQPVSQGLFWAQHNDRIMVIFRDLKPDNVRFRENGTMAVVDLGSSATFSVAGKNSGLRRMVSIVERQPTPVDPCGQRRGSGLLQGQSRLGHKYVGIPWSVIENFCKRAGDRGLAVIGGTTRGFRNEELKNQESPGRRRNKHVQQRFDSNLGCWQDSFAFFRMLLHELTRLPGQNIVDWSAQAEEAAAQGVDGIKRMLLGAAAGGKPKQPLAFDRLADYLYRGLCPCIDTKKACENGVNGRLAIMEAVTHVFPTLAILTPDQERQFSSPKGLPFSHGAVHKSWPTGFLESMSAAERAKVEKAGVPELSYAKQPGMDGGVLALQDIPGDAFLGVYVGRHVRNHICGTVYDAIEFPSRFNVTGHGVLKIFKQTGENKFTCDAQNNLTHDVKWCQVNGNSGPFMNAATSQKLANCIVDRRSAWYDADTGLIWMLVWSKAAGIKKGKYCLWFYNYKAGAGKLWHFGDKD